MSYCSVNIPVFPRGGPKPKEGMSTYYLANLLRNLHKNEENWTDRSWGGGMRPKFYCVNLPLQWTLSSSCLAELEMRLGLLMLKNITETYSLWKHDFAQLKIDFDQISTKANAISLNVSSKHKFMILILIFSIRSLTLKTNKFFSMKSYEHINLTLYQAPPNEPLSKHSPSIYHLQGFRQKLQLLPWLQSKKTLRCRDVWQKYLITSKS